MNRDNQKQSEHTETGQELDDALVRDIIQESAKAAPKPSPDLFARIEENIQGHKETAMKQTESGWHRLQQWIANWRDILFRPQVGWGLAAVQAIVLCIFLILSPGPGDHDYKTLSMGEQTQSQETSIDLYVMFHDQATIAEMEQLLNTLQGRIKDGPAENGVYLVAFADDTVNQPDFLIKKLQQSKIVTFAEQVY